MHCHIFHLARRSVYFVKDARRRLSLGNGVSCVIQWASVTTTYIPWHLISAVKLERYIFIVLRSPWCRSCCVGYLCTRWCCLVMSLFVYNVPFSNIWTRSLRTVGFVGRSPHAVRCFVLFISFFFWRGEEVWSVLAHIMVVWVICNIFSYAIWLIVSYAAIGPLL